MKQEKDQMSPLDLDTWSGKTYQEHSAATKERTSESSSKKRRKSQTKPPLFLDLTKENGLMQEPLWEKGGALLGEYSMHSFGECPSVVVESTLSQILEDNPHPKYYLSEKACQGILRRAERRGKKLPELLRVALERQSYGLGGNQVNAVYGAMGNGIDRADTIQALYENHGTDSRVTGPLDVSPTVTQRWGTGGNNVPLVHTFSMQSYSEFKESEQGASLMASGGLYGGGSENLALQHAVRRLIPLECELLQGYPDGWTNIPPQSEVTAEDLSFWREVWGEWNDINGKKHRTDKQIIKWLQSEPTDSARYKGIGNSFAIPNAFFVISRCVEQLRKAVDSES